jgi:hypothetical protein
MDERLPPFGRFGGPAHLRQARKVRSAAQASSIRVMASDMLFFIAGAPEGGARAVRI